MKSIYIVFVTLATIAMTSVIYASEKQIPEDLAAPSKPTKKVRKYYVEEEVVSENSSVATQRPNAVYAELLGRGALYSIGYDRSLSENWAVGGGFSYFGATSGGVSFSAFILPFYGNYYFSPGPHRGFISAGVDVVVVSSSINNWGGISATGALGTLGGGYEYRGEGGFLFRAAPYVFLGQGGVRLWGGLSFGGTF